MLIAPFRAALFCRTAATMWRAWTHAFSQTAFLKAAQVWKVGHFMNFMQLCLHIGARLPGTEPG